MQNLDDLHQHIMKEVSKTPSAQKYFTELIDEIRVSKSRIVKKLADLMIKAKICPFDVRRMLKTKKLDEIPWPDIGLLVQYRRIYDSIKEGYEVHNQTDCKILTERFIDGHVDVKDVLEWANNEKPDALKSNSELFRCYIDEDKIRDWMITKTRNQMRGTLIGFCGNRNWCEDCDGWDGESRRCDCGNRRVDWEVDIETGRMHAEAW